MIESLKYVSIICVCATIAYIALTLRDCGSVGETPDRVVTAPDSAFQPVIVQNYRPKSTPFEKPVKPVSKLPKNVKETDIKRVINIHGNKDIQIIETKDGSIFIPRGSDLTEVTIYNYDAPLLQFGLYPGIGISFDAATKASPSVSVAIIKISGDLFAPMIVADLRSIGIGIGYQFYHDITITPSIMWNLSDMQRTIKINVSFQL